MQVKRSSISESLAHGLDRHFATCAAAATLGLAAIPAGTAQAAIHYSGPLNLGMTAYELTGTQVSLDIDNLNGASDSFFHPPGSDLYFYLFINGFTLQSTGGGYVSFVNPQYGLVSRLAPGTAISAASNFGPGGYLTIGYNGYTYGYPTEWNGTHTNNFVGFSVERDDGVHYGWIRLNTVAGEAGLGPMVPIVGTATVVDFAYEGTPGLPIIAGDVGVVPEPGACALGMLALGAIARRPGRRQAALN